MKQLINGELVDMTAEEVTELEQAQAMRPVPTVSDYQAAVQAHVDEAARSKQFNDGVSLASYKESTVPLWAAQAATFIAWRDGVWVYCYAELAKVQAGERPQPSVEALLAELPAISWPAEA